MSEALNAGSIEVVYRLKRDASSFSRYQRDMAAAIAEAQRAEKQVNTVRLGPHTDRYAFEVFGSQLQKAVAETKAADAAISATKLGPSVDRSRFAGYESSLRGLERATQKTNRIIDRTLRYSLYGLGTAVAGVGAAFVGAAVETAQFEDQMYKVQAISGATARQMDALRESASKLADEGRYSATELATAQSELVKGGMSAADVYGGGLRTAYLLASAGQIELADAATYTVNAMNLFNIKGTDAVQIADGLAAAANNTTASVDDFGMALTQGGAAAKVAGLGFRDTIVWLEALAKMGIKNSDAGTSLKSAIIQATAGLSPRARKMLKDFNIELFDSSGKLKGVADMADNLVSSLGKLKRQDQINILGQIFGSDGVRAAIALMEQGRGGIEKLDRASRKQGEAARIARIQNQGLAFEWKNLINVIKNTARLAFMPFQDSVVGLIKSVKSGFRSIRPALVAFSKDVNAILTSDVGFEQKMKLLWARIEQTGVPAKVKQVIIDGLSAAFTAFAQILPSLLAKAVSGFGQIVWKAFTESSFMGKAVITAMLLSRFGPGIAAIGLLLGKTLGSGGAAAGAAAGGGRVAGVGGGVMRAAGWGGLAYVGGQAVGGATGNADLGNVLSYAGVGAAIGSAIPGIGTIAGAVTGAVVGGLTAGFAAFSKTPTVEETARGWGEAISRGLSAGGRDAVTAIAAQIEAERRKNPGMGGWRNPSKKERALNEQLGVAWASDLINTSRQDGVMETTETFLKKVMSDMATIPAEGRKVAVKMVLEYIAEMERQGEIKKGSYTLAIKRFMLSPWKDVQEVINKQNLGTVRGLKRQLAADEILATAQQTVTRIARKFAEIPDGVKLTSANAVSEINKMLDALDRRIANSSGVTQAQAIIDREELAVQEARVRRRRGAATGAYVGGAPGSSMNIRVHADEAVLNAAQMDMIGRDQIMGVLSATGAQTLRTGGTYASGGYKDSGMNKTQYMDVHLDEAAAEKRRQRERKAARENPTVPGAPAFSDRVLSLSAALAKAELTTKPTRKLKDPTADDRYVINKMIKEYERRVTTLEGLARRKDYSKRAWPQMWREIQRELESARGSLRSYRDRRDSLKDAKASAAEDKATAALPIDKQIDDEELRFNLDLASRPTLTEDERARLVMEQKKKRLLPLFEKRVKDLKAAVAKAKGKVKETLQGRLSRAATELSDLYTEINSAAKGSKAEWSPDPTAVYMAARTDLYSQFGSNSRPMPTGGNFAGFGQGLAGSGGARPGGTMVTQNISISQPPPDPHAFARSLAFEIKGAV